MRKIAANYIFPITSEPKKNGIVVLDDNNFIVEIIDTKGDLKESEKIEFYNGVIVPGFINAHCHLELSYLKKMIPKNTGHPEFIKKIVALINSTEVDQDKIKNADFEMFKEGISAVGDISNTKDSSEIKKNSKIYYHTFIEAADFFNPEELNSKLEYLNYTGEFYDNFSFSPHSPYTCSPEFISELAHLSKNVFSIHNQEAEDENEMYIYGKGSMYKLMEERNLLNKFKFTGKNALISYLDKIIREDLNIILVHNIFTSENDIEYAESKSKNIYWAICPNSNKYIQNKKVDVGKFIKNKCKILLGTDSLATNDRLSIIEEMKNFTNFKFEEVLKWATINGAKALKIDDKYGSLEAGKQPGINLIKSFDFENMNLTVNSKIIRLV